MAEPQQSLQNHARIIPAYHYFIFGAFTINLILSIMNLASTPSFGTAAGVLTASALIVLAYYARVFALKAQDRVIRLEMRLRMKELLPPALQPRINEFTPGQLVAMRFACDAELPELAAKVLSDNVQDKRTIKRMVKEWQGDFLRV
jgi:Family of unknown function (DUF6526)